MTASWIMLVIYFVILTWLLRRNVGRLTLGKFILNDRSTNTTTLIATNVSTSVGAGVFLSLIAIGYEAGMVGVYIGLSYAIGFVLLGFLSGRLRDQTNAVGANTMATFLAEKIFHGHKNATDRKLFLSIIATTNLIIFFFLLAAQFVALSMIINTFFHIGHIAALIVSAVFVITYTSWGGLAGVYATDKLQFVLLTICIFAILLPLSFSTSNNYEGLRELPDYYFTGTGYGLLFLVGLIFLLPSPIGRADFWQRIMSARTNKGAKLSFLLTACIMMVFYIALPLIGMAIRLALGPKENPSEVAIEFLRSNLDGWILGVCLVGLIATIMSSADSFLNILSFVTLRDSGIGESKELWTKATGGDDNAKQILVFRLRIASCILGIVGLAVALIIPSVVDLMIAATTAVVVFVPVSLDALIAKEPIGSKTAILSVGTGAIVNFVIFFCSASKLIPFEPKASYVPAFLCAAIIYIVGRLAKCASHTNR